MPISISRFPSGLFSARVNLNAANNYLRCCFRALSDAESRVKRCRLRRYAFRAKTTYTATQFLFDGEWLRAGVLFYCFSKYKYHLLCITKRRLFRFFSPSLYIQFAIIDISRLINTFHSCALALIYATAGRIILFSVYARQRYAYDLSGTLRLSVRRRSALMPFMRPTSLLRADMRRIARCLPAIISSSPPVEAAYARAF